MKLIKLNCNNCDAPLEVDLDKLQAYCPYCGQKLLLDFDHIDRVLDSREQTKRAQEKTKRAEEVTKRFQIEQEFKEKKEIRENKIEIKRLSIMGIFFIIVIAACFFMDYSEKNGHITNNEIQISASAEDLKDESVENVIQILKNCGFENINVINEEDLVFGLFSKEGEIKTIKINGDKDFLQGDWFPKDAVVSISYHGYPEE